MKHIDAKYLWLQNKVKAGELEMDGVATVLNVADINTKKLTKVRRSFLMYLIGLVEYDGSSKMYVPAGEDEFNAYMQKKYMGQNMKTVRRVVLNVLANGMEEIPTQVSKPLVKAMTLLALQPVANGARTEEFNYQLMVKNFEYSELFMEFPWFMLGYALTFFLVGMVAGYFFKNAIYKYQLSEVVKWASEQVTFNMRTIEYVDDWDPERHEFRQFRVLRSVDDAESGEEYFREVDGGMARFVKLDRRRRRRHGFAEIDMLNAYDLSDGEGAEEEPMEVDEEMVPAVAANSAMMAHGQGPQVTGTTTLRSSLPGTSSMFGDGANAADGSTGIAGGSANNELRGARSDSATREYLSLPGSPHSDEPPTLPLQDVNWDDLDEIMRHLPVTERNRALQMQEVALFDVVVFKEYLKTHLSSLYPNQPDMCWDYPAWWTRNERHGFSVFGTFVEQWFLQQGLAGCNNVENIPWSED